MVHCDRSTVRDGGRETETAAHESLQREARALGDPSRHRIFRFIADADEPVGVAELTAYVKLNHNAVRQHLSVLKAAGLVREEVETRDRPGRPRLLYHLDPEASGRWGTAGPYAWLAGLLTDALRLGLTAREAGRREGLRRAATLGPSDAREQGDGVAALESDMAQLGFRPTRAERGRTTELVVGRCPFVDVAEADPHTVCELHLGLAEGLAEGLGDFEVTHFVKMHPRRAGCRVALRHTVPAPLTA